MRPWFHPVPKDCRGLRIATAEADRCAVLRTAARDALPRLVVLHALLVERQVVVEDPELAAERRDPRNQSIAMGGCAGSRAMQWAGLRLIDSEANNSTRWAVLLIITARLIIAPDGPCC